MKFKYLYIFLFLIFLISSDLYPGTIGGVITGRVSTKDGEILPSAVIRLEGTALGAITDKSGNFKISKISDGKYNLLASLLGYSNFKKVIEINDGDSLNIDITLIEDFLRTNEIVISANKKIQAVQDVPISISVIDKTSILQKGVSKFDETLMYVGGVQVNQDNVSIRGSSGIAFGLGSRVGLLIDGTPFLSADNGDMKFDILPMDIIDRIEIIKGAGSALYGTGAIGGVINIITTENEYNSRLNFRGYSGIFTKPTYKQWEYRSTLASRSGLDLNYMGKSGIVSYYVSGGYIRDESYFDYHDSYKFNALAKLKIDISKFTKINILANTATDNVADWVYWNSLDSATRPSSTSNYSDRLDSKKYLISTEIKHIFNPDFFSSLKFGFFKTDFYVTVPTTSPDYRSSNADAFYSELQFNNHLSGGIQLTYGLTANYNNVNSVTFGMQNQSILAVYSQVEYSPLSAIILTAGGRFDLEKTTGSEQNLEFSPKFGANISINDEQKIRLSLGKGFRAPNVAEKYASVSFSGFKVVPNPLLKSETGWSAEVGYFNEFKVNNTPMQFDIAFYTNWLDNLIEAQFDVNTPGSPIKFMNITAARIMGLEIEYKTLLFGFLGFQTSLNLMNPKDLTLNETLKYRSNVLWYNSFLVPFGYFNLIADYRFMSRVERLDNTLGLQIKDYDARVPAHILDLRLITNKFKISDMDFRFSLNCKNILNYYYTEIPGNLGMTRLISLQMEAGVE